MRPDVVIAGAARSGTTNLAGALARHPGVLAPSIKEPNYYSTRYERGEDWYDGLFDAGPGLRVDASAQYTYPSLMRATFARLAPDPDLKLVYLVREPVERAYSHYCQEFLYLDKHEADDFGDALATVDDVLGASRYDEVLPFLASLAEPDHLLVVPFESVTRDRDRTITTVLAWLGLDPAELPAASETQDALFANERAVISNPVLRTVFNRVRATRLYPRLRAVVGPERMRRMRSKVTSSDAIPSLDEALRTCTPAQQQELADLRTRCAEVVRDRLAEQDARLGTGWSQAGSWLD